MRRTAAIAGCALLAALPAPALEPPAFDVLIQGGTVYDGSGGAPRRADLGLRGDRIEAIGDLPGPRGAQ